MILNNLDLFLYFLLYSFMGWSCEVIYCSIPKKTFVNRGFLNCPICHIYGFGAIFIIKFLYPFKDVIVVLFLLAVILTSTLEYITSFILEKLFNTKWWDYSNNEFNINGRVCLLNSTLFGLLAVVLVEVIHPYVQRIIGYIPQGYKITFSYILAIILVLDIIFTVNGLIRLQGKLKLLSTLDFRSLNMKIKTSISEINENKIRGIKDKGLSVKENINFIHRRLKKRSYQERRVFKAFPHMKHKVYNEQLIYFKELLREKKNRRKG